MKNNVILIVLLIVGIIGGYYFFSGKNEPKDTSEGTGGNAPKLTAQDLMRHKGQAMRRVEKHAVESKPVEPQPVTEELGDDQKAKEAMATRDGCIARLKQIEDAKTKWAGAKDKFGGAQVSINDILPYLPESTFPTCPGGGTYTLDVIGVNPSCSVAGHGIPSQ